GMAPLARVPRAKAKYEAAATDLIERLNGLRRDPGVAVERRKDPGAHLDLRGRRGNGTGHRDAFPPAMYRSVGPAPQPLVAAPADRSDEPILEEDRQGVVAPAPLCGRLVHLERVLEVE